MKELSVDVRSVSETWSSSRCFPPTWELAGSAKISFFNVLTESTFSLTLLDVTISLLSGATFTFVPGFGSLP